MSREFIVRWTPARNLWADGMPRAEIAAAYEITDKALAARIAKWRRYRATADWFPPRR